MSKSRKSPQEKKELEYQKDHFTFGWHSSRQFPKTWKRKKAYVNREYRRKSAEILAPAKPGMTSDEMQPLVDDLTAVRFQKSVSRKRLWKTGTVSLGEKVKRKLEKRTHSKNRKVKQRQRADRMAASAVHVLNSLDGDEFLAAVRRAQLIWHGDLEELKHVFRPKTPLDSALHFLYLLARGSVWEVEALKRNPELGTAFARWMVKANRILEREERERARKGAQKRAIQDKLPSSRKR